jgi:hypothetical protein
MSVLFYREERDADFFNACELVRVRNGHLSIVAITKEAILMPAKSFYIHPREYSDIIRTGGKRLPENAIRRELHLEIMRRFKRLTTDLSLPASSAIHIISRQTAPRFYISESRAVNLYYMLMKKRKPLP